MPANEVLHENGIRTVSSNKKLRLVSEAEFFVYHTLIYKA